MIWELCAAFYDTADMNDKFMIIYYKLVFSLFLSLSSRIWKQKHFDVINMSNTTRYYSGMPIKFANEIMYTVSAQFTNQTVRVMEI